MSRQEFADQLVEAIRLASEQAIYMPVQRQNQHGGQMVADAMAAIPIPTWEAVIDRCDQFVDGWIEAEERG